MNLSEVNWDFEAAGTWPLPIKLLAIFLACVIAIGVWIKMDTLDQLDALELVEQKETELKTTFEVKQKKAVNLEAYTKQLKEIEESFGAMLRQLPDKTEVANLLVDVSQTGLASGLEFELFKPQEEIKQEFYAELPINIRVIGKYDEFGSFISGLASLPRIVTIHNVVIKPRNKDENMTMDAMVKTYRYLDDSEQAAAGNTATKRRITR
ncbi:MAG: type 4a pilus biogenesis protein PilO [Gammaproteobacteria bacterium]